MELRQKRKDKFDAYLESWKMSMDEFSSAVSYSILLFCYAHYFDCF